VWRIVRDLVDDGVTIFLTTHYLEEADRLADRIAVLDHGRLIAEGTPAELKRMIPGGSIRIEFADAQALGSAALAFAAAVRDDDGLTLHIPSDGRTDSLHDVLDRLREASLETERVSVHSPDLDEVFLALTGSHEAEGGRG
jgi:ABC-2 type transport system ATP-binding protein